jgi:hypothetical protein
MPSDKSLALAAIKKRKMFRDIFFFIFSFS